MRFILSFMIFTVFGFVQQSCQQSATTTKTETTKTNSGVVNSNSAAAAAPTPGDEAPRISLADAKKDFDAGNAVFLDTRAAASFKTEHIKGALNMPAEAFEAEYKKIPSGKKIIAYCS